MSSQKSTLLGKIGGVALTALRGGNPPRPNAAATNLATVPQVQEGSTTSSPAVTGSGAVSAPTPLTQDLFANPPLGTNSKFVLNNLARKDKEIYESMAAGPAEPLDKALLRQVIQSQMGGQGRDRTQPNTTRISKSWESTSAHTTK